MSPGLPRGAGHRTGANVVLESEGRRVVLQLRDDHRRWGVFGGLVDDGEDPAAAAIREIGEELTLRLDPGRLVPLRVFEGDGITTHLFRYPLEADGLASAVLTEGTRFEPVRQGALARDEVVPWHWFILEWYWRWRLVADGRAAECYRVARAGWEADSGRLLAVRREVFVVGQGVDPALEDDGRDPGCVHFIATDPAGEAIATGRLSPEGRVGRMAVLDGWRGLGVGAAVLEELLAHARASGLERTYLHSQTAVVGFYERFGFVAEGEEFFEAGIPHVTMVREGGEPRR